MITPVVFFDFEASSLSNGYPIEIGWCAPDLDAGWACLIKPVDHWVFQGNWAEDAEEIHGLDRDFLIKTGWTPREVLTRLNTDLAGATLLSDAPYLDFAWMRLLVSEAGGLQPTFPFGGTGPAHDAEVYIATAEAAVVSTAGQAIRSDLDQLALILSQQCGLVAHRALDDAIAMALRVQAVGLMEMQQNGQIGQAAVWRDELVTRAKKLLTGPEHGLLRLELGFPREK